MVDTSSSFSQLTKGFISFLSFGVQSEVLGTIVNYITIPSNAGEGTARCLIIASV